eukprot:TRINITY_DN11587_c0_g1_i2.p1 TRINITY_DN11587_c0_g1~~TRINITY_DN11587_c0_g1_i2.p1  ORF type:complete len:231 (+),score=33.49 TRINITY_DN11587_c0_g1_i2:103-795(+)
MSLPSHLDLDPYTLKVIVLGCSHVGKTALSRCFVDLTTPTRRASDITGLHRARMMSMTPSTIGAEFSCVTLPVGKENYKLQIWDTAGTEKYDSIAKSYIRGAHGVLLVYDATDATTMTRLRGYHDEVLALAPDAVCVVVANKCDLNPPKENIDIGVRFAGSIGATVFSTSALTASRVAVAFVTLTEAVCRIRKAHETGPMVDFVTSCVNSSVKLSGTCFAENIDIGATRS